MKIEPGTQFDLLTIITRAADDRRGRPRYFARCVCGREMLLGHSTLFWHRRPKSCGCKGFNYLQKSWTQEEIAYLKKWYADKGAENIAKDLGRTFDGIRGKAAQFGLKSNVTKFRCKSWRDEEIAALKLYYPRGGAIACLKHIPNRTKSAIRGRAAAMKIRCPRENRFSLWTKEEDEIVKANYPSGGWQACLPLLPSFRTPLGIGCRARKFGAIRCIWPPEDVQLLRETHAEGGVKACAEKFTNHTKTAIRGKLRSMGLYARQKWPEKDIEILRKTYPRGVKYAVKKLPHHSLYAIRQKARSLRIRLDARWNETDLKALREYYPLEGRYTLHLPRFTPDQISRKAISLGLHVIKKRWGASHEYYEKIGRNRVQ